LAGETLFVAGPSVKVNRIPHDPAEADPFAEALEARVGGSLLAVSVKDGKTMTNIDLEGPPVFDGMATAYGRLYLAGVDGRVVCLGRTARAQNTEDRRQKTEYGRSTSDL
jgi:hypothetical protein